MQSLLLSCIQSSHPGLQLDAVYRPAQEVGGDFYHVESSADGGLLVVIGDVAGKGVAAALLMAKLSADAQSFYAHASTDFLAPRVTGHYTTARRVTVRFSEPVLGVSHNSFKIAGAGGTLHFATGDRKATLTLKHPLRRGIHQVTLTAVIADMTLNRLARTGFAFRVR